MSIIGLKSWIQDERLVLRALALEAKVAPALMPYLTCAMETMPRLVMRECQALSSKSEAALETMQQPIKISARCVKTCLPVAQVNLLNLFT